MAKRIPLPGLFLLAGLARPALAQPPAATQPPAPVQTLTPAAGSSTTVLTAPTTGVPASVPVDASAFADAGPARGLFESDRAFSRFVGPVSNPILSKDPRNLTEARLLFIQNNIPADHPLGGGNFQVYALQARVALTDRLTLIADKDGITDIRPKAAPDTTGLLNINVGLKYMLVRDVENQFLWSAGFTFEPPTGEADVFQNHGSGVTTVFSTVGKEVACRWHVLNTTGYQFGMDRSENSDFFYNSFHIDREIGGWFYPLAEVNWFHYTHGGNRGLPPALGDGDGLLNLGTSGVTGNNLVTLAVGAKAKLGGHAEVGAAYEFPLTNRKDLINNRLVVDFILRY